MYPLAGLLDVLPGCYAHRQDWTHPILTLLAPSGPYVRTRPVFDNLSVAVSRNQSLSTTRGFWPRLSLSLWGRHVVPRKLGSEIHRGRWAEDARLGQGSCVW